MENLYLFLDEAGCLTFTRGAGVSRYFILCSVTTQDDGLARDLIALRRELALEGNSVRGSFHASNDRQSVRDRVFSVILRHDFEIHATILDK